MNILLAILYTYITASVTAISSYNTDFHRLNLILYLSIIFYTLFFLPLTIFMHIFYQGYMFLYFLSDLINALYPYRVYVAIIFTVLYYLIFLLVYKIGEHNMRQKKGHAVITRIVFFTALILFLYIVLFRRTLYIGTIQDFLHGSTETIFSRFAGSIAFVYPLALLLFWKLVITRIKSATEGAKKYS